MENKNNSFRFLVISKIKSGDYSNFYDFVLSSLNSFPSVRDESKGVLLNLGYREMVK